jgi:hypothetical protein
VRPPWLCSCARLASPEQTHSSCREDGSLCNTSCNIKNSKSERKVHEVGIPVGRVSN